MPSLEQLQEIQKRVSQEMSLEYHRMMARAKAAGEFAVGGVYGRSEKKALEESISRFDEYMNGQSDVFEDHFDSGSSRFGKFVDYVSETYEGIDISPSDTGVSQIQLNGGTMLLDIHPQFNGEDSVPSGYFYHAVRTEN